MFYEFPVGLSLDEVRRVVSEHNARMDMNCFIEKDCGDHVIFNYILSTNASWPEPGDDHGIPARDCAILRECRGLIFSKDGRVLARRWAKFFNVNEKPWTQANVIDWSVQHVVLEKLDGSMITPFLTDSGLRWGTKMGLTEQALQVEEFVAQRPAYERFAREVIGCGVTPIFEWCSRKQTIVVDYPEDALILTGLRDNATGLLMDRARMVSWTDPHGIPVVEMYGGTAAEIQALLAETKALVGAEGWIIRFENGHQLKTKSDWYCAIHGTKELLSFEKDVWALVLEDRMDDAMALMDAADRARCERFTTAFNAAMASTAMLLQTNVTQARIACDNDKKRFATEWMRTYPEKRAAPLLFQIWDGRDPVEVVKTFLKKNCSTITKVNAVRDFVQGLTWEDYRDRNVVLDD
jgi:RNA ligase